MKKISVWTAMSLVLLPLAIFVRAGGSKGNIWISFAITLLAFVLAVIGYLKRNRNDPKAMRRFYLIILVAIMLLAVQFI